MTSTKLQLLEQSVAAATAKMVEQGAIDQETSTAVWTASGNKAGERLLYGSIIECVDPTSQNVTYYTTATSGDLVSGANNQEKLTLQKNGGNGATTKKTGAELAAVEQNIIRTSADHQQNISGTSAAHQQDISRTSAEHHRNISSGTGAAAPGAAAQAHAAHQNHGMRCPSKSGGRKGLGGTACLECHAQSRTPAWGREGGAGRAALCGTAC